MKLSEMRGVHEAAEAERFPSHKATDAAIRMWADYGPKLLAVAEAAQAYRDAEHHNQEKAAYNALEVALAALEESC